MCIVYEKKNANKNFQKQKNFSLFVRIHFDIACMASSRVPSADLVSDLDNELADFSQLGIVCVEVSQE